MCIVLRHQVNDHLLQKPQETNITANPCWDLLFQLWRENWSPVLVCGLSGKWTSDLQFGIFLCNTQSVTCVVCVCQAALPKLRLSLPLSCCCCCCLGWPDQHKHPMTLKDQEENYCALLMDGKCQISNVTKAVRREVNNVGLELCVHSA